MDITIIHGEAHKGSTYHINRYAGAGSKNVVKSIERQMFWRGIPKVYKLNFNVNAMNWDGVSEKIKTKISNRVNQMS